MEQDRPVPSPTAEEVAALIAAVERFIADTAVRQPPAAAPDRWRQVALLEGLRRFGEPPFDPWLNI